MKINLKFTSYILIFVICVMQTSTVFSVTQKQNAPDDPDYVKQWGLYNNGSVVNKVGGIEGIDIGYQKIWEEYQQRNYIESEWYSTTIDASNVVVGLIDNGISFDESSTDLRAEKTRKPIDFDTSNAEKTWARVDSAVYFNYNEMPTGWSQWDNIDSDKNGKNRDFRGWNFIENTFNTDASDNHGLYLANIISGKVDNSFLGVGLSNAKILPLKITDTKSTDVNSEIATITSRTVAAIDYAAEMGAKIINCSFTFTEYNQALFDVMKKYEDSILFVCAAGNSGTNNDKSPRYPASFGLNNIISVAGVDSTGRLTATSSFGATSVDIAAPGENIYVSGIGNSKFDNGTSFAAAFVTGVCANLYGINNKLTPSLVKEAINNSSTKLPSLKNAVKSKGMLNFYDAVKYVEGNYNKKDIEIISHSAEVYNNTILYKTQTLPSTEYAVNLISPDGNIATTYNVKNGDNYLSIPLNLRQKGIYTLEPQNFSVKQSPVFMAINPNVNNMQNRISAGEKHTLMIDNNGKALALGDNTKGQLGQGQNNYIAKSPTKYYPININSSLNVLEVVAGNDYSLVLDNDGFVHSFGSDKNYSLGRSIFVTAGGITQETRRGIDSQPSTISFPNSAKITTISGGEEFSFAIDVNQNVYCWGTDNYSLFGDGRGLLELSTPVKSPQLSALKLKKIVVGKTVAMGINYNNQAYVWGLNSNGQSGNGIITNNYFAPTLVNIPNVADVAVGDSHCVLLDKDGNVYTWGANNQGQLGLLHYQNVATPTKVTTYYHDSLYAMDKLINSKSISAYDDYTAIITMSNTMISAGRNLKYEKTSIGDRISSNFYDYNRFTTIRNCGSFYENGYNTSVPTSIVEYKIGGYVAIGLVKQDSYLNIGNGSGTNVPGINVFGVGKKEYTVQLNTMYWDRAYPNVSNDFTVSGIYSQKGADKKLIDNFDQNVYNYSLNVQGTFPKISVETNGIYSKVVDATFDSSTAYVAVASENLKTLKVYQINIEYTPPLDINVQFYDNLGGLVTDKTKLDSITKIATTVTSTNIEEIEVMMIVEFISNGSAISHYMSNSVTLNKLDSGSLIINNIVSPSYCDEVKVYFWNNLNNIKPQFGRQSYFKNLQ